MSGCNKCRYTCAHLNRTEMQSMNIFYSKDLKDEPVIGIAGRLLRRGCLPKESMQIKLHHHHLTVEPVLTNAANKGDFYWINFRALSWWFEKLKSQDQPKKPVKESGGHLKVFETGTLGSMNRHQTVGEEFRLLSISVIIPVENGDCLPGNSPCLPRRIILDRLNHPNRNYSE